MNSESASRRVGSRSGVQIANRDFTTSKQCLKTAPGNVSTLHRNRTDIKAAAYLLTTSLPGLGMHQWLTVRIQ